MKTLAVQGVSDIAWRRFRKEAEVVSRLDHPNAIRIHDFGLIDGKRPFYVIDIVQGESLAALIQRNGPLPVPDVLRIFEQVSLALAHAHGKGIIHRDIKPSNIMLDASEGNANSVTVRIVDFGISKLVHEGADSQNLTSTGEVFGSPFYMSPEQCFGQPVDHRSDIYSVGCALFEALTGTPPHIGSCALATILKHREAPLPSMREASLGKEFPEGLEAIVGHLLEKNADDRYQSLQELGRDLELIARDPQVVLSLRRKQELPSKGWWSTFPALRLAKSPARGWLVCAGLAAALVLCIWAAGGNLSSFFGSKSQQSLAPDQQLPPSLRLLLSCPHHR